jgi:alpha-aminoadipic semialdehyde synthase
MAVIGIRREDKSVWERRTPIVPDDVERIVAGGTEVHVQRSPNRCFPDEEYARAGAVLTDDLSGARVVLAVKEIPHRLIERGKAYFFFSHTIKGQPYNMPMLRRLLELECTVLDYELVTDGKGVRTIAFGRHAGLAGAIDTLWALGRRWARRGLRTPLAGLRPALDYGSVAKARADVEKAGREIAEHGLPAEVSPVAVAVTGEGGKVFGGAMEVLDFLPARRVPAAELARETAAASGPAREIWAVPYGPEHLVEPAREDGVYTWERYVKHPDEFRARFGRDLPLLTAVIHGIFWAEGYPRFILRDDLAAMWSAPSPPKLELITDITCDLGGSNEALARIADPGEPAYTYDPATGTAVESWDGPGPLVVAVDILPAELPVDSSEHFSRRLTPLVPALARGVPDPADETLPGELRRAVLAHRGRLVSPWDAKLAEPLREHGGKP